MSVQCCPLTSSGDFEGPSCSSTTLRTARKDHICCECDLGIKKGDKYEYTSGVWDGYPDSFKTCLSCKEIRDHFSCDGWMYGHLWSDLEENFFPSMKAGGPCMEGLSPEAKARLFEERMKWFESLPASSRARRFVEQNK